MKKYLLLPVFLLAVAVRFCNAQCTPFIQAVPNTIFPCHGGGCNGMLIIDPMWINGTPPYTFTSNFGTVTADSPNPGWTTISGLCAGSNVVVNIADAAGCTGVDYITLIEAPAANPSISVTPVCGSSGYGSVVIGNLPAWYFQLRLTVKNLAGWIILSTDYNPGETSSWVVNNLTPGNYTFEISFQFTDYIAPGWLGCTQVFPFTVTTASVPSALITPSGPTTFCSGSSVVLNAPVANNRSYQWKKGANLISGATLSSYTATTGGNYRVIVTNTITGCSRTTGSATVVTVNAKPAATITPQGPTTFCAGGSVVLAANTGTGLTYKWKKGGNYISGATLLNYTATTAGTYRVEVTNSNGCSKLSAGITITVPCREGVPIAIGIDINVFPNPSSGDFVFEIENISEEKISIHVYDVMGKLVLSESIHNSAFIIHHSKLVPGIYSAEIKCGNNREVTKIIKTN